VGRRCGIVADVPTVPWSVRLCMCLCVCLLDTTPSPRKRNRPIQMPFGKWTSVGPRNHLLTGGRHLPRGIGSLGAPLAIRPFVKILCLLVCFCCNKKLIEKEY